MSMYDSIKGYCAANGGGGGWWYTLQPPYKNMLGSYIVSVTGTINPYTLTNGLKAGQFSSGNYMPFSGSIVQWTNFTIMFNFMIPSTPTATNTLFHTANTALTQYVSLSINTSNLPVFTVYTGSSSNVTITSSTAIETGKWYHIACTHTDTAMAMYLNGISVGTGGAVTLANPASILLNSSVGCTSVAHDLPFVGYARNFMLLNAALPAAVAKRICSQAYIT